LQLHACCFSTVKPYNYDYLSIPLSFPSVVPTSPVPGHITKLDPKRYKRILVQMRNEAPRKDPDAYPKTLAAAYRISSGWGNDDLPTGGGPIDIHSAFLADTAFVTKARDPDKVAKAAGSKGKRAAEVICFICGATDHCCGTHWIQVPGSQTLDLEPGPYAPEHTAYTT
jgi:hypothetical protein